MASPRRISGASSISGYYSDDRASFSQESGYFATTKPQHWRYSYRRCKISFFFFVNGNGIAKCCTSCVVTRFDDVDFVCNLDEEEQRDNSHNSASTSAAAAAAAATSSVDSRRGGAGSRKGSHDSVGGSGSRSNSLIIVSGSHQLPWRKESVTIISEPINEQEDDEEAKFEEGEDEENKKIGRKDDDDDGNWQNIFFFRFHEVLDGYPTQKK